MRTDLGNALAPAGSVCGYILHAFVLVNESSTPESVRGQCAAARRSCRARKHGNGCNAGLREQELRAFGMVVVMVVVRRQEGRGQALW